MKPEISIIEFNKLKKENEELKRLVGMMVLDLGEQKKENYLKTSQNKSLTSRLLGISRKQIYYDSVQEQKDLLLKKR